MDNGKEIYCLFDCISYLQHGLKVSTYSTERIDVYYKHICGKL